MLALWNNPTVRTTIAPLLLMIIFTIGQLFLSVLFVDLEGELTRLPQVNLDMVLARPTEKTFRFLFGFVAINYLLLLLVPGKSFLGPITPAGNQPVYKLNGVQAFLLFHVITYLLGPGYAHLFSYAEVWDELRAINSLLCLVMPVVCLVLYFKGRNKLASQDAGRTGFGFIWDYWWGTELHPRILGVNLKQLTNCRLGLIAWSFIPLCCAAKQFELNNGVITNGMWVNLLLQNIYLFKFYVWESGYFWSIDMMHDRAGFYIVFGVCACVPTLYTSHSVYLTKVLDPLPNWWAATLFVVGVVCIYVQYLADEERQRVRRTNGKTLVWGKPPVLVLAEYTTGDGKTHKSLLLASGFWGITRHFHYLLEWTFTFCWVAPVGFDKLAPWFYLFFLIVLLVDRTIRDEARCAAKYGKYWKQYCSKVSYRLIPGIY